MSVNPSTPQHPMRYYHCFYTDLPDEFVEAYANELVRWAMNPSFEGSKYLIQSHSGTTPIVLCGYDSSFDFCRHIEPNDWQAIHDWMAKHKGVYGGGYWKSLATHQRSPSGAASGSGGGGPVTSPRNRAIGALLAGQATGQGPGLGQSQLTPAQLQAMCASQMNAVSAFSRLTPGPSVLGFDLAVRHPSPLKREMKLGEITGYRCWRITDNGNLQSVYQKDIWYDQIMQGRGLEDWGHRGIHAWKEPNSRNFQDYISGYFATLVAPIGQGMSIKASDTALVTGTILLWGDVVEHEHGYRGEYAKVKSIDWLYPSQYMMGREKQILDDLKTKYGV